MRLLFILAIMLNIAMANYADGENVSPQCEKAMEESIKVHWDYINGRTTITKDYNERVKAEKICGFSLE